VIRKKPHSDGQTKVTFSIPDPGQPVSVVADFNDWNPEAHPLRKRGNGTRSVAVMLPSGVRTQFRYVTADGTYFDDPEGDYVEPNGLGDTHTVVLI
jgi:1,4-alpha-glucan branching enzyme